mmetsp:Transcript_7343/g.21671  ORF Transcript_7343/g.21671 Transcript_7343/m.21671 type:complete len:426 (-) Transcript_7343:429-1706(-)
MNGGREGVHFIDSTRHRERNFSVRPNRTMHISSSSLSSADEDDIDGHGDEDVYDWLECETRPSDESLEKGRERLTRSGDETDEEDWTASSDEVYDWLGFDTGQGQVDNKGGSQVVHQRPPNISVPPSSQGRRTGTTNQNSDGTTLSRVEKRSAAIPRTPDGKSAHSTAPSKTIFTPPTPDSPLVGWGAESSTLYRKPSNRVIKDTKRVKRKKAALPPSKPHADVVKGDWLTNRYVVNNYILLNQLGKGSYGEVRLCKEKITNKLFAIKAMDKKVLQKKVIGKSSTSFDDVKREVEIMRKLRHENVVRLYEVMDDPNVNKLYLVIEYMKRGDLIQIAKEPSTKIINPLTDEQVWDICRQVLRGLKYLHNQDIVHGDIKPQNILVSGDGLVKIADFGIAKMMSRSSELQLDTAGGWSFLCLCARGLV